MLYTLRIVINTTTILEFLVLDNILNSLLCEFYFNFITNGSERF